MPSPVITRPYEAVYILDPDLGDEQIASITARYRGLIEAQGGEVQKLDVWERRKLAYEVKGRTEGIYVVMQFSGTATVEVELRRIFQISEDQIRYLIVRLDENAEEAAAATQPASVAARPAPAAEPAQYDEPTASAEPAQDDEPAAVPESEAATEPTPEFAEAA